jgi:hypothetical protein
MNTVLSFEYDQYSRPRKVHHVKVLEHEEDPIAKLVIDTGETEIEILNIDRDQWGVWLGCNGHTIAQEDDTRSFLDALIKGLQYVKDNYEWKCSEATKVKIENPQSWRTQE